MLLTRARQVVVGTEALQLRSLTQGDVTEQWIAWFQESDTRRFIAAARRECTLQTQAEYVRTVSESESDLLLGLVDSAGALWATSGVQGVHASWPNGPWIGCLVDPARRGGGVGRAIVTGVRQLLAEDFGCAAVYAGISADNPKSVATFTACEFRSMPNRADGSLVMGWSADHAAR